MKNIIAIVVTLFLLMPICGFTEIKEIISEGDYNMGDGETPSVAESRALLNAKRIALEQAGTYVESYSKVKNFQLVEDEIKVLASGTVEVTILDKKRTIVGDGISFWVKIKAKVKLDKMEEMARNVKEKSIIEDYKKIQREYDKNQKEMEKLKKELAMAQGETAKKKVETRIADEEKLFQANEWFEKGLRHTIGREDDKAIEEYTQAIVLNPDYAEAYNYRGFAYYNRGTITSDPGQHELAVKDFRKVVAMKPGTYSGYLAQGAIYVHQKEYERGIEEINKAIALNPDDALAYGLRGFIYMQEKSKDPAKALADWSKVIARGSLWSAMAYANRGVIFLEEKQYDMAIDDLSKSIELTPRNAPAYLGRGLALAFKGQFNRSIEDINRSIELNPKIPAAYNIRGMVYAQTGNPKSIDDFHKACDMGLEQGCSNWLQSSKNKKTEPARERRVEGTYNVVGTNPDGTSYSGMVTITRNDGAYVFVWTIGSSTFRGTGNFQGETLIIDWGQSYPVIYKVAEDGRLIGTWNNGNASEVLTSVK
ncbi:MAG TPA: tetratricopeptide repeat protein [Syntrophales bacterium]